MAEIRKNIQRDFTGFTYDNEPPVGLRPEPLGLPEPKMHIMKWGGQEMEELIEMAVVAWESEYWNDVVWWREVWLWNIFRGRE